MAEILLGVGAIVASVGAILYAFASYVRADARAQEINNNTLKDYDRRLNEMDARHQREIAQVREEARQQRTEDKQELEKVRDRLRAVEAELNVQKGANAVLERSLQEANKVRDEALKNLGKRDAELAQLHIELNRKTESIEALHTRLAVVEVQREEEKRLARKNETPKYASEPAEPPPSPATVAAGEGVEPAKAAE